MPHNSIAADKTMDFCVGVQRCQYKKCRKNGTHHLHINSTYATCSGTDKHDVMDRWYCDDHFKLIVPSQD